jgi:thiol-disulfide isomerase/thioredoxin
MGLALLAGGPARSASPKVVVAEKFTATWCQYCPGAARGFQQIKAEHDSTVVMIAYHQSDDPFTIPEFTTRRAYYSVGGYPTAIFDGVLRKAGGSYDGTMYPDYLPLFTQRAGVTAPIEIHLDMEALNAVRVTVSNPSPATVSGTLQVSWWSASSRTRGRT